MQVLPFLVICALSTTLSKAANDDSLLGILQPNTDRHQNLTAVESWENADQIIKNAVNVALKNLLPFIMETSSSTNVSSVCMRQLLQVLGGIRNSKVWAMRFLDSSGKMINGFMYGSISSFGHYDQCVETEVKSTKFRDKGKLLFTGQYCSIDFKLRLSPKTRNYKLHEVLEDFKNFSRKDTVLGYMSRYAQFFHYLSIRLGVCVPSGCSHDDIDQIAKHLGKTLSLNATANRCDVKEDAKFGALEISVITCFSFFGFLLFIGSLIDIYGYYKKITFRSKIIRILVAFSLFSNFKRFVNTSTASDTLSCLNGVRFLSLTWIILAHTYLIVNHQLFLGLQKVQDFAKDFAFQVVLNAFLGVDTFFFIGGLLVCYVTIKLVREQKYKLNVPVYVLHRLWRIMPAYVHVIMFMFLLDMVSSGPIWYDTTHEHIQNCYDNWWTNLIFINNFYDADHMCLKTSWYIASDFQMYVGALLILFPLIRWPKVGISLGFISIIACIIYSGVGTYVNDFPPAMLLTHPDKDQWMDYWNYFYFRPFVHIGPYCIGILSGYLLATKPNLKMHPLLQVAGWCTAFTCSFSSLYGVAEWNKGAEPPLVASIFYASLNRSAWTLGISWMVIACATGHGGIINYILSWKAFVPLGRLSYIAYLVHPIVQLAAVGSVRTQIQPDHYFAVWIYCGHLFITYAIAFVGSMLIEAPFMSMEKILLERAGKKEDNLARQKNTNLNGSLHTDKNGDIAAIVINESEESEGTDNTVVVYKL